MWREEEETMAIAIFYLDVQAAGSVENQVKEAFISVTGVNDVKVDTHQHRIEIVYDEEAIGMPAFRRKLTGLGIPIKA